MFFSFFPFFFLSPILFVIFFKLMWTHPSGSNGVSRKRNREREGERSGGAKSTLSLFLESLCALLFLLTQNRKKKKKVKTKHNSRTNNTSNTRNTSNSVVGSVGYFRRICLHLVSFSIFFYFLQSKTLKTK